MRVAAVIQARMKSTRLPGKVLMPLAGRPVLQHIIERLRRARSINEIAITTSTEPEDDAIAAFGQAHGVAVTRGPEHDVLGRYEIAARQTNADIIMRVTGDSPLIDPWFLDYLIAQMQREGADFLVLEDGVKCIQEGVDPLTRRALDVLLRHRSDPVAREHVTGWLKLHPESARVMPVSIPQAYQFAARLSIDTPADVEFFRALAERLDLSTVSLVEVAALLKREPWLMTINAHVHQKAATEPSATILLRADGGGKLGLGHLMRTIAIGEALRDHAGFGVRALTGVHPAGDSNLSQRLFADHKIPVVGMPPGTTEEIFVLDEARRTKARGVVFDVRTALPRVALEQMRALYGLVCITIDDGSERRLGADVAIYPPVPQAEELDWTGFRGETLIGPEWVVLPSTIVRAARERRTLIARAPRVLISMGGSDPAGLTAPIAVACTRALGPELPIDVVIGPAFDDVEALKASFAKQPGLVIHSEPKDIASLYVQSTFAIVSFGITTYELAALGVPALYIALTEDHRSSAMGAQALGFGRFVTMAAGQYAQTLARAAARLISSKDLPKMSAAGRAAIDGRGAERVAEKIAALMVRQAPHQAHAEPAERLGSNLRAAGGE